MDWRPGRSVESALLRISGRFDEICAPRCLPTRDVFVSHRIGIDYIKFKGNFCVHLECSECFLFSVNELGADPDS